MHMLRNFLGIMLLSSLCIQAQTVPEMRNWQDQQGRTIKAALVKIEADNVVLQLENGTVATVPLSRFSAADQAFARKQGATSASPSTAGVKTQAWPPLVSINKKDIQITNGEQDAGARSFIYQSGSFQFISQAPLTGTVVRDIASDFELTSLLFKQMPWGWEPKPRNGKPYFVARLFETEKDFIAGGGFENSAGGYKDDDIVTKFSTLGLKKVGERYAFDAKLAGGGDMVALIAGLLIADMRGLSMPWSSIGLEQFLEHGAYRNGSFAFTSPERAVKEWLEQRRKGGYQSSAERLVKRLKTTWAMRPRNPTTAMRIESHMDDFLLLYYFGFLEGEGKGARLHQYYSAVAKDSLDYRRYNEGGRKGALSWKGTFEDHAVELNNQYIVGDQSDEKLLGLITEKFKSVGIKL